MCVREGPWWLGLGSRGAGRGRGRGRGRGSHLRVEVRGGLAGVAHVPGHAQRRGQRLHLNTQYDTTGCWGVHGVPVVCQGRVLVPPGADDDEGGGRKGYLGEQREAAGQRPLHTPLGRERERETRERTGTDESE